MAKCPKCGQDVEKPVRALRNRFFFVEAYECKKCNSQFKVKG